MRITKNNLIVMGASAGGIQAIKCILNELPQNFFVPILVVQHFPDQAISTLATTIGSNVKLQVKEAVDKDIIEGGTVYVAPPGYHMLVEQSRSISLSLDEHVNWSRPSIDVLFDSAANVYEKELVGILLTGANHDGANGLSVIARKGGVVIIQSPSSAEAATMPQSGIDSTHPDFILSPLEIGLILAKWSAAVPAKTKES